MGPWSLSLAFRSQTFHHQLMWHRQYTCAIVGISLIIELTLTLTLDSLDDHGLETIPVLHLISVGLTFVPKRLKFGPRSLTRLVVGCCFYLQCMNIMWFSSVDKYVWITQICDHGSVWLKFWFLQLAGLSASHLNVHAIQFGVYWDCLIPGF